MELLVATGARLGINGARSALDTMRTHLDIIINNWHPMIKLEYATRFILGGGCVNAPAGEIGPLGSNLHPTKIRLEGNASSMQFEGVLLYKLVPKEANIVMSNSIYLVLCWKCAVFEGFCAYMTLIEHEDSSVYLERSIVEKYYYQLFSDKPRKLDEAIRCSWHLSEKTLFTINMTAGDNRVGNFNVEIREGKNKINETKPTTIELDE
jgi:hypothetical protein